MRFSEVQSLLASSRSARPYYRATPEQLTITDNSRRFFGCCLIFGAIVFVLFGCFVSLWTGSGWHALWDLRWLFELNPITGMIWGLFILGLAGLLVRRRYEIRQNQITAYTQWLLLRWRCRIACKAEDVISQRVSGQDPDAIFEVIAIRRRWRNKRLTLLPISGLSFEQTFGLVRAYVRGLEREDGARVA